MAGFSRVGRKGIDHSGNIQNVGRMPLTQHSLCGIPLEKGGYTMPVKNNK